MNVDIALYEMIKDSGIDLILSLPCILLKGLLEEIDERHEIQNIPITREEEGIGIAAGAYLAGRTPALLIQNSVVFIMSHRGAEGEKINAQIPMGQLTPCLLDILNIRKFFIDSLEKIKEIKNAVEFSKKSNQSVGILLKRKLWRK